MQVEEASRALAAEGAAFAEEKARVAELVRREEEGRKALAEQTKQLEEDRKRWLSEKRTREEEVRV